jgi:hypothetical protein
VVCVDESNKQHLMEVVQSLPTREGDISKYDSEYIRGGVSNMFMFFEPLGGKRHIEITNQRTSVDFAEAMKLLKKITSKTKNLRMAYTILRFNYLNPILFRETNLQDIQ